MIAIRIGTRPYLFTPTQAARFESELEEVLPMMTGHARRAVESCIERIDRALCELPIVERVFDDLEIEP